MRKFIFSMLLLCGLGMFNHLQACDVCGTSSSNNVFGLLPNYRSSFLGLRYQIREVLVKHPVFFRGEKERLSQDYFQTIELWGRYGFWGGKLQIYGFLPYNLVHKKDNGINYFTQGLGDASLMTQWTLYQTIDSAAYRWRHQLQLAGGVQLPTGRTSKQSNDQEMPANLQPGSGSFDFLLNINYSLQYRTLGLNIESGYQINSKNGKNYRFGSRLQQNIKLFYRHEIRQKLLLPSIGINYQRLGVDHENGQVVDFTGGQVIGLQSGVDIFFSKFSLGFTAEHPIWQDLGQGYLKNQWQAGLKVLFTL